MVLQRQRHPGRGALRGGFGRPAFARDGGEGARIARIYDGPDRRRTGSASRSPTSSRTMTERVNYLFLAHSKLHPAAFGPRDRSATCRRTRGASRIWRDGRCSGRSRSLSGELANMSHSVANLEHHHFKYACSEPGGCNPHVRHRDAELRRRDRRGAMSSRSRPGSSALRNSLQVARPVSLVHARMIRRNPPCPHVNRLWRIG